MNCTRFLSPCSRELLLAVLCAGLVLAAACDQPAAPGDSSKEKQREVVKPPSTPPQYSFAPGVRDAHPEVAAFVRTFLETCLAGDYTGYRKLVSRLGKPESKDRFQAVYYAIRSVTVESIEPIEVREAPQPAYRVVSAIDFNPDRKVALRGGNRSIAMIVFQEDGEWRMLPAPSDLQPQGHPAATASAPAELPAPDMPWDQDGDY
jgi:hypothetical protein